MAIVLAGFASGTAWAHHSFVAEFDPAKPRTIEGTVTELQWENPHTRFYMLVKNPSAPTEYGRWEVELGAPNTLVKYGWNRRTLGPTESLHVIERLTRTRYGHLISDVTATDPKAWTGPYHQHLEAGLVTGDEILEWVCFHGGGANATGGPHLGGSWYTEIEKLMSSVPQNIREVN